MPAKRFYVAPSVADTLTVLAPNPYQFPGSKTGSHLIYNIRVAYGNVANATANAGFIHIETTNGSWDFAYGGGLGGATNSGNAPAENIPCAIIVPEKTNVSVYVLDATAHITEEVTLMFKETSARENKFKTMAAGGVSGSGDTVALTEESITTSAKLLRASLTPAQEGRIYQIRISGGSVVDAKSGSGYIKLLIPNEAGPYEFTFRVDNGGAATGGPAGSADVIDIPEGIPVHLNSAIDIKITTLEAMKYPHISLSYW